MPSGTENIEVIEDHGGATDAFLNCHLNQQNYFL